MYPCSFCAGMCRPMRAGRFIDIPEVVAQRGAASGGKRRSIGAAESMACRRRPRVPRSGTTVQPLARAFYRSRARGFTAC